MSSIIIPILVAVVPTVIAALIGVFTYREQKKTDRNIELRNRRMQAYESYLTAYRKYLALYDFDPQPPDNSKAVIKAVNEYWLAYSNLFHVASDPVLRAVSDFHNWAWVENPPLTEENVGKFNALYAKIIITMREDVSERTELSLEEVENRLPFNFAPRESTETGAAKGELTE